MIGFPHIDLPDIDVHEQALLSQQLKADTFSGCIEGYEDAPLKIAPQLIALATQFSDAPVSGFNVGAVAIGGTGRLYLGANMEFAGVPLNASLHAEQSAVLNAWFHGETRVEHIFISAAPCGHCRQFLWELPQAASLQLHFQGQVHTLDALLPCAFTDLNVEGRSLFHSPAFKCAPIFQDQSNLAMTAVRAAQYSYAPYTSSPEGVALECVDGRVFTGRTAESSAFNPTVCAITCAMNQRNFSHSRKDAITVAVHAKLSTSITGQRSLTKTVLRRLSNVSVQAVAIEML